MKNLKIVLSLVLALALLAACAPAEPVQVPAQADFSGEFADPDPALAMAADVPAAPAEVPVQSVLQMEIVVESELIQTIADADVIGKIYLYTNGDTLIPPYFEVDWSGKLPIVMYYPANKADGAVQYSCEYDYGESTSEVTVYRCGPQ